MESPISLRSNRLQPRMWHSMHYTMQSSGLGACMGSAQGACTGMGHTSLVYSKDLPLKPPELNLKLQVCRLRLRIEDLLLGLGTKHGLGFGHRSPVPYDSGTFNNYKVTFPLGLWCPCIFLPLMFRVPRGALILTNLQMIRRSCSTQPLKFGPQRVQVFTRLFKAWVSFGMEYTPSIKQLTAS